MPTTTNVAQQGCGKWECHRASKDCNLKRSFNCYCWAFRLNEGSVHLGTTKSIMHCILKKMEVPKWRLVETWGCHMLCNHDSVSRSACCYRVEPRVLVTLSVGVIRY